MTAVKLKPYLLFFAAVLLSSGAWAAEPEKRPATTQFEIPPWFKASFLDLQEDAAAAARDGKRLLVYIGQDGCPYCRELMQNNFGQKDIADYTQKHFDVLAINMWGDSEVTDFAGNTLSEKELAEKLGVKYTPTLLFFNEQGDTVLRINGYFPPHQMRAALRYVGEKKEKELGFRAYYARLAPPKASGKLNSEPFFAQPPFDLRKRPDNKPLVVFFEQKQCETCDTLHKDVLRKPETQKQVRRLHAVQLDMWSDTPVVTPHGKQTTAREWAQELNVIYAPAAVFFDQEGKEVLRIEAMLKSFHVQSAMDYVASAAYIKQPNFQRYIDERAAALRAKGVKVDIWK